MSSQHVRMAHPADLDVLLDIWHEGIVGSIGAPPPQDVDYRAYFRERIDAQDDVFRFFVVEGESGEILAWQSVLPFRANPATRRTMAEVSAYTRPEARGSAATLMGLAALFRHGDESALHYLFAFVAQSNPAAAKLAMHFGMQRQVTLPASPKASGLPGLDLFIKVC